VIGFDQQSWPENQRFVAHPENCRESNMELSRILAQLASFSQKEFAIWEEIEGIKE